MCNVFDSVSWRRRCERLAKQANKGCGLVYENYERSFTLSINHEMGQLDAGVRAEAIEIAKRYGWATAEQLEQSQRAMEEDGSCSHGIDFRSCWDALEHSYTVVVVPMRPPPRGMLIVCPEFADEYFQKCKSAPAQACDGDDNDPR